jgi:antitoxin component YwqK of YwqJK toxin-antitoxin module
MSEEVEIKRYPSGSIKSRVTYVNNKKEGRYQIWYDGINGELGQLEIEGNYVNGKVDGLSRSWYKNGFLQSDDMYKNGNLNGRSRSWHSDGSRWKHRMYLDDKLDGPFYEWDRAGESSHTLWRDGDIVVDPATRIPVSPPEPANDDMNPNDIDITFPVRPSAAATEPVREGVVDVTYYPNGNKQTETILQDNGLLLMIEWYENGKMVERKYKRDSNRQLEGPLELWYENGNPLELSHYNNGKREGEAKVWYENGQLDSITMYHNDKKDGECKRWYSDPDHQLYSQETYYQGLLEGEQLTWHPNGKLAAQYSFHLGKLDGEGMNYDENGILTSKEYYRNGKLVKVISPLAKCHEKTDSIATGEDLTANTVIIFSPFRKNDESECYSYDSWEGFMKSENDKEVFIWQQTPEEAARGAIGRPLKYAPVMKLPYSGVWVQSTYNLLTRFNTYILKSIGTQLIGSSFGVSRLHGASEHVYIAIPINRRQAMNVPDVKDIDENIFVPEEEDYIDQDNYQPGVIVQITRGGTFAETDRRSGELYGYYTAFPSEVAVVPK